MYVLVDDESNRKIGEIRDIEGFFSGQGESSLPLMGARVGGYEPVNFKIIGLKESNDLYPSPAGDQFVGNVWLQVLASDGAVIGEYYIASMAIVRRWQPAGAEGLNLLVSGLMDWFSHQDAKRIWGHWAIARPTEKNLWAELPLGSRGAWLEVVGLYHAKTRQDWVTITSSEFVLDGKNVIDLASFYCAIGEAVHGPGGYFGWNFAALEDCLKGTFGGGRSLVLHWHDFDVASGHLLTTAEVGERTFSCLDVLLKILREAGVEIARSL